ncbi:DUF2141 domain-containing protein [Porifericola rhodea]|uniref:DUF2141 domain-containing protein n=1 Tax=Porifericola rhodea TaxID=930972 RepID=UPI00266522BE|nr:DUF2141 domain-containing protein [Porifericola rhodea]WKN30890.1 DUF2141 domain-containing protein [Porifericola rhodea]
MFIPRPTGADNTARIIVNVSGIQSNEGLVQVALYASNDTFLEEPFMAQRYQLKESGEVEVVFDKVPHGEYAIAVYHDKNSNNELDTNFMGIPTEPYGFSNNYNPKLSAPKYKNAIVTIDQNNQQVDVRVS